MACSICQDDIRDVDKERNLFVTTCAHTFHNKCWIEYVSHQPQDVVCPNCKTCQFQQIETFSSPATPQETSITIVSASSPSITYDLDNEDNYNLKRACMCSKHMFVIICMIVAMLVIVVSCLVTTFK